MVPPPPPDMMGYPNAWEATGRVAWGSGAAVAGTGVPDSFTQWNGAGFDTFVVLGGSERPAMASKSNKSQKQSTTPLGRLAQEAQEKEQRERAGRQTQRARTSRTSFAFFHPYSATRRSCKPKKI